MSLLHGCRNSLVQLAKVLLGTSTADRQEERVVVVVVRSSNGQVGLEQGTLVDSDRAAGPVTVQRL